MHARLREFCLTMIVAGAILGAADPSRAVSFRISPQDEPDPTPTPARYGEEGGLFAAASQPAPGGGETGGGGQTTDEQDTDKAAKTFASVVGQNVSSDFVAKHFSLLFGGVVLNQFKIEKPEGSADFVLEDGNTEAKAFLEAGFRYRWAWLDRDSAVDQAVRSNDPDIVKARDAVVAATRRVKAAETALKAAAELEAAKGGQGGKKDGDAPEEEDAAQPTKSTKSSKATKAAKATPRTGGDEPSALQTATQQLAQAKSDQFEARNALETAVERYLRKEGTPRNPSWNTFFSLSSKGDREGGFALVPDDWTARLGYVFDSSTSANDVVAVVGATDLYGELGVGWNLVNWGFPPDSAVDAPIRGSINLELDGTFFTDSSVNDAHGRGIFGLGFVFGVPIRSAEPTIERIVLGQTMSSQSVVELLVRAGAVVAEVPAFANKETNTLKQEHGNPKYVQDWGFGMDFEFNIPIAEKLGYIVARGQLNADFDPNPWFIQLGYTIPLGTLASGIAGAANGGGAN